MPDSNSASVNRMSVGSVESVLGRKPSINYVALAKKYKWLIMGVGVIVIILAAYLIWQQHQRAQWLQATDYYHRADYQKAAPILLKMSLPNDPEQLRIYGQTMLATNHLDQSLQAYQKLYQQKNDPAVKLQLGNIYNLQKKYDLAAKTYSELIDSNPNYIQAYVNLATVYRLQGNQAKAIDVANRGLTNNSHSVVLAELMVGLTADRPQSEQYSQAVEQLRKLNPKDPLLTQLSSP